MPFEGVLLNIYIDNIFAKCYNNYGVSPVRYLRGLDNEI